MSVVSPSNYWARIKQSRLGWALLVTLFVVLIGFVAVLVSGFLSLPWLLDEVSDNSEIALGILFPAVLLAASLGCGVLLKKKSGVGALAFLGLKRPNKNAFWLTPLMLLIYVIALLISTAILHALSPELAGQEQEVANTVASVGGLKLTLMIISVGLLTPIAEEAFFRGLMISLYVRRIRYPAAILITSILFGLAHGQLNVGMDTFMFGLILGFLTWKTGSIYPAIGLHMLKNCLALYVILS